MLTFISWFYKNPINQGFNISGIAKNVSNRSKEDSLNNF